MSTVYELLGFRVDDSSAIVQESRLNYRCPFTKRLCTAGNRNLYVEVVLNGQTTRQRPGICTITASGSDWMVCPNRLFALDSITPPEIRRFGDLSPATQDVLTALGATPAIEGHPLGAWAEITIKEKEEAKTFDYRFDFIVNPVRDMSAHEFADEWELRVNHVTALFRNQTVGYAPTRQPGFPLIVEVMTASTSGSNQQRDTGIKPAFYSAWNSAMQGAPIKNDAPSTNVRQTWGRMASQLIAKSEAGEQWGGRTVWLMQDLLLSYIHETTFISKSQPAIGVPLPLPLRGANIVSYKFGPPAQDGTTRPILLDRFIADEIPSMYDQFHELTMHGILHAPFIPKPGVLGKSLLSGQKPSRQNGQDKPSRLKIVIEP